MMQHNELMKQKIHMYKEMKAEQILELQMREQGIVAASVRKGGRSKNRNSQRGPMTQHFPEAPHQPVTEENETQEQ